LNINDTVLFPTPNGTFQGKIISINEYRPPEMKYAIQIFNYTGYLPDDGLVFAGDENLVKME
jgi:hypothetical protein